MSNILNFSNDKYKNINYSKQYTNIKTSSDAFMLCIKDLDYLDLENLCLELRYYLNNLVSLEDCYKLTQGINVSPIIIDKSFKDKLLELAYICLDNNKYLGNKTIMNGKINTSSWLSHSLYEGKFASQLAQLMGYDKDIALKLGILHDIGRKKSHTIDHITLGYEYLIDNGFENEATCSITHSFLGDLNSDGNIKGCRCGNCDPAVDGFSLDDEGNVLWDDNTIKDDAHKFLENYKYNEYDVFLNIADLMCTDKGLVSPYDRVKDIRTRKIADPRNNNYFKATFINLMVYLLSKIDLNNFNEKVDKVRVANGITNEYMDKLFYNISNQFYILVMENIDNLKLNNSNNKQL